MDLLMEWTKLPVTIKLYRKKIKTKTDFYLKEKEFNAFRLNKHPNPAAMMKIKKKNISSMLN